MIKTSCRGANLELFDRLKCDAIFSPLSSGTHVPSFARVVLCVITLSAGRPTADAPEGSFSQDSDAMPAWLWLIFALLSDTASITCERLRSSLLRPRLRPLACRAARLAALRGHISTKEGSSVECELPVRFTTCNGQATDSDSDEGAFWRIGFLEDEYSLTEIVGFSLWSFYGHKQHKAIERFSSKTRSGLRVWLMISTTIMNRLSMQTILIHNEFLIA